MAKDGFKIFSLGPLKGLWHYAVFHLALPFAGEYALCFVLTGIFNAAVLGGALDTPKAALGVMSVGLLYRYFRKTSQPKQAPAFSLPPITPADVARLSEKLGGIDTKAQPFHPSPYL
jgi:hypothetical protein